MDLLEEGLIDPINHWYYKHKYWFIKTRISDLKSCNSILTDVGAGSALFSKQLKLDGLVGEIYAIDPGYKEDYTEPHSNIHFLRSPTKNQSDIYLLTDVLEHIDNDLTFLSDYVKLAQKDSIFIITVPAHQFLWSGHDEYLKHYRRYSISDIELIARSAGLQVLESRYIYSTLFPFAFLQRKLSVNKKKKSSKLKVNLKIISKIFDWCLRADKKIDNKKFGVSVFLVCKLKS
jgi:hypothetical protein